jgi:hypothetical protein
MRPILHLAAGLLACILGGCSFLSLEHMYGIGEGGPTPPSHPWHEWPAKIGMAALGFPLLVVFSPLIAVEALTDSGSVLREGRPGISTYIIAPPAIAAGYLAGLPFLVLGLPWEFGGASGPEPPRAGDGSDRTPKTPGRER